MPRFLVAAVVLLVAITLYGVFDCLLRDREHIRIMPKWAWALVILFVPVVGVVLWYVFGRSSFTPREPAGPPAPDDDPEFLRKLSDDLAAEQRREQRRAQEEQARSQQASSSQEDERKRPRPRPQKADGAATGTDAADAGPAETDAAENQGEKPEE